LVVFLIFCGQGFAAKFIWRSALVGGGSALNDYPSASLETGDIALVTNDANKEFNYYIYDSTDNTTQSLPDVVEPLDGGGAWNILQEYQDIITDDEVSDELTSSRLTMVARNETGATIPALTAVYVSGFNNVPLLGLAGPSTASPVGITVAAISDESNGVIVEQGDLSGVDTDGYSSVGTVLYLGAGGIITETRPTTGNVIIVGTVTVKDAANGEIEVMLRNGFDGDYGALANKPTLGTASEYDLGNTDLTIPYFFDCGTCDLAYDDRLSCTDNGGEWTTTSGVCANFQMDFIGSVADDDDCTGQQYSVWYDRTDAAMEYCAADSGAPTTISSGAETDPIVGAINGLIKADGGGTIAQAVAGTDYLEPDGDGSSLTGITGDSNTGSNIAGYEAVWQEGECSLSQYQTQAACEAATPTPGTWTAWPKLGLPVDVSLAEITNWPAAVDATEVGFLDGVTSGIQGQINSISTPTSTFIEASSMTIDTYMAVIADATEGNFTKGDIIATNNDAVYYSVNDGKSWDVLTTFDTSYVTVSGSPNRSYYCMADHTSAAGNEPGTAGGADYWEEVRYNDDYPTWSASSVSYTGRDTSLVRVQYADGYIYASPVCETSCNAGMWRTNQTDGTGWTEVLDLPVQAGLYSIAENSTGTMVATVYTLWDLNYPNMFRSTDDGANWSVVYTPPNTIVSYNSTYYMSRKASNTGNTPPANTGSTTDNNEWWYEVPNGADSYNISAWSAGTTYNGGRRHLHDVDTDGTTFYAVVADAMINHSYPTTACGDKYLHADGSPMIIQSTTGAAGSWTDYDAFVAADMPACTTNIVGLLALDGGGLLGTVEASALTTGDGASIVKWVAGVPTTKFTEGLPAGWTNNSYSFYLAQNTTTGNVYIPGRGNGGKLQVSSDEGESYYTVIDMTDDAFTTSMNNISDFVDNRAIVGYQNAIRTDELTTEAIFSPNINYPPGIVINEKTQSGQFLSVNNKQLALLDKNLTLSDTPINNASPTRHGFLPKLSGTISDVLRGDGSWGSVSPDTLQPSGKVDEYVLTYESSGDTFEWQAATGSGGEPAGDDTQVQYNSGGSAFGAEANFTYNSTDDGLNISTDGIAANRGLTLEQHNSGAQGMTAAFYKSRGTDASPTTMANGDYIGVIQAYGYDGTSYNRVSQFGFRSNGAVSTGSVPTDIVFFTGSNPATLAESLRLKSNGDVQLTDQAGTYTGGIAYVCIDNTGVIFASETVCEQKDIK